MSKNPERRRSSAFSGLWRVAATAPDAESAAALVDAFDELGAVSAFEDKPGGSWRVEGLSAENPDRGSIAARLALAWLALAGSPPELLWERVPQEDWLVNNQASFPPLVIGRYFIYGSHHEGGVPPGRIGLLIDAATAFGTGEHATTRGCLLALDAVTRQKKPNRILDMGTGTGVLAIAAAKTRHRRVIARDIDAESARVAGHNAKRNGVASLVMTGRSAGYAHRAVMRGKPYDLILANILARPLTRMARDLGSALAPDGIAILSGLLTWQEYEVMAAHRLQGLTLRQRIVIDGWSTLVLSRGRFRPFRTNNNKHVTP